jgi:hypothetical protein
MGYMLTTDMDKDDIDAIHLRNQAAQAQHAYRLGPSLEADLPPWCSSGRSSPVPDDLCSVRHHLDALCEVSEQKPNE